MSDSITVILTLSNVPNAARVSVHVTANESPASFREKASEATKIPLDSIRLIFRGRLVGNETDKKVIEEFKLEHDSVIHCMGKPVETLPVPAASSSAILAAGSKVTVTAPSPTAAPIATQTVTLTTALANLRALNSSSAYLTAVTTLEKILSNIANHPLEEKYRKVKRGNAAFNKRLGGIPGGEAAMLSVGFSIDTVDGEPFYVMHPSPEAWPKLVQDRADLALAAQSAANAVSAAPPPMAIPSLPGAGMPDISGFGGMPNMTPQMQQAAAQMMRDPQQIQAMLQV
jgi:ubiquilin